MEGSTPWQTADAQDYPAAIHTLAREGAIPICDPRENMWKCKDGYAQWIVQTQPLKGYVTDADTLTTFSSCLVSEFFGSVFSVSWETPALTLLMLQH